MSTASMWIGGFLVPGSHSSLRLMSLLVMSRDDALASPRVESQSMLNRGRSVVVAGLSVRAGSFPESLSMEASMPAHDAWEEFDVKTGGVC
jgi:hypothetical protein